MSNAPDKWQALQAFWGSFGIPAYEQASVPKGVQLPYISYNGEVGAINEPLPLSASIWCRDTSWEWISKGCRSIDEVRRKHLEDITIEGHKYIWNMSNVEWILRPSAIDEIGCIHTTQGYDLNYVGVIFGEEIDYDEATKQITINPAKHFDSNVQRGSSPEELKTYLINSYKVMMSRGIKGCYVYACNPSLRNYLSTFLYQ